MKRLLIYILLVLQTMFLFAQQMVVYKKDGTKLTIPVQTIDSVRFEDSFNSVAFVGTSFLIHGYNKNVRWYSNSALAPSIVEHSIPKLMEQNILAFNPNAKFSYISGYSWETQLDTFNYEKEWKQQFLDANPDIIFMIISGNSVFSEKFTPACETMFDSIHSWCPSAKIFATASWHGGEKEDSMRYAANEKGVSYVELHDLKLQKNMWSMGDWYYADSLKGFYNISNKAVAGHPNDYGGLQIVKRFLDKAGIETDTSMVHNIRISNLSNATISVPNQRWLKDGIVSVKVSGSFNKCEFTDNDGKKLETTVKTNTNGRYYLFVMPDKDVKLSFVDTLMSNLSIAKTGLVDIPTDLSESSFRLVNVVVPAENINKSQFKLFVSIDSLTQDLPDLQVLLSPTNTSDPDLVSVGEETYWQEHLAQDISKGSIDITQVVNTSDMDFTDKKYFLIRIYIPKGTEIQEGTRMSLSLDISR